MRPFSNSFFLSFHPVESKFFQVVGLIRSMETKKINLEALSKGKEILLENDGEATFSIIYNDNTDANLLNLTGLKMVISSQLPKMPREYIVRLVFDEYVVLSQINGSLMHDAPIVATETLSSRREGK